MIVPNDEPLKFYLREAAAVPPLSQDEQADLLKQFRIHRDQAEIASKRLIEGYLYLVVSIVERHHATEIPMLELIQEGNAGLFQAIRAFSGTSDDFAEYAAACIEKVVSRAIAEWRPPSQ